MRTQSVISRRMALTVPTMAAAAAVVGPGSRAAAAATQPDTDPWPSLSAQIFDQEAIPDGSATIGIDAPYRAEDAAVVPLSIRNALADGRSSTVKEITVVIDQNPSPVAAKFRLGENSGIRTIATRVRVDSYTNIHAVAAMADGRLVETYRFVKAAGGCSAPASKQEANGIPLGTLRFRQFPPASGSDRWQAQVMVRHPNNSGMQMDQVSRLYVPAHFVSSVRIWQGDDLLMEIESGISISENPEFRFDYRPNGATHFRAEARDNEGGIFQKTWPSARA